MLESLPRTVRGRLGTAGTSRFVFELILIGLAVTFWESPERPDETGRKVRSHLPHGKFASGEGIRCVFRRWAELKASASDGRSPVAPRLKRRNQLRRS